MSTFIKDERRKRVIKARKTARARTIMNARTRTRVRTVGWALPTLGELKFVDVTGSIAIAAASNVFSALTLLNGMAQGTTASTRIGRKISMRSLLLRWSADMGVAPTGGSPVRILVFYDNQSNAAAPAATDVLEGIGGTAQFISPKNLSNRDRFITLIDTITEPICITNNEGIGGQEYRKVTYETMFNAGSAGTIADITTGSIFIMIAQIGSITTAGTYTFFSRIRYTDV